MKIKQFEDAIQLVDTNINILKKNRDAIPLGFINEAINSLNKPETYRDKIFQKQGELLAVLKDLKAKKEKINE